MKIQSTPNPKGWDKGERNSLSGKQDLPHRPARACETPAHIGEALLPRKGCVGNPEGSQAFRLTP